MEKLTPIEIKEWQEKINKEFDKMEDLPVNHQEDVEHTSVAKLIFDNERS